MHLYTVQYYKRIDSRWLKGRVRNLSMGDALQWAPLLAELFDTKMVKIVQQ